MFYQRQNFWPIQCFWSISINFFDILDITWYRVYIVDAFHVQKLHHSIFLTRLKKVAKLFIVVIIVMAHQFYTRIHR